MVKKIRLKFVIITMTMLTVVFSIVFIANHLYNNHLYKQEMLKFLEVIAESSTFFEAEFFADDEYTYIYAAVIDGNGEIVSIQATYDADENVDSIIRDIYSSGKLRGENGSYVFAGKSMNDGTTVIALANVYTAPIQLKKIAATGILIVTGYILLLGISLYLSRYITTPAQEALEREKQFLSNASHELKTPVAAIILNAQAMSGTEPQNKHLGIIISEAERMKSLIQRLLTLAYADESDSSTERKSFSLSEICEEMALSFESFAFENRIDFNYDIQENVQYNGVSDDIRQVVSILLDNAFKYTSPGGKITLRLTAEKHRTVLTVHNTGEGISPEDLPHVFERFYCRDKSRNNSFGLGLAIASAVIKSHGGTIKADSVYGEFAEFTVNF